MERKKGKGCAEPFKFMEHNPRLQGTGQRRLFPPYPHSEDKETETHLRELRRTSYQMPDAAVFP